MLAQLACSRRSTAESQIDQNQNLEGRKRKRKLDKKSDRQKTGVFILNYPCEEMLSRK